MVIDIYTKITIKNKQFVTAVSWYEKKSAQSVFGVAWKTVLHKSSKQQIKQIHLWSNDWINKQKQKFKQLTVLLFLYGREHKIYARYKNLKSAYFTLSPHFHLLIGTFYSLFHILYTNTIEDFPIWNFANVLNCYYRYEIIFPPSSVEKIICESYV